MLPSRALVQGSGVTFPCLPLAFYYGVLDDSSLNMVTAVQVHVLRSRWSSEWWSTHDFRMDLLDRIDAIFAKTVMYGHPLVNTRGAL